MKAAPARNSRRRRYIKIGVLVGFIELLVIAIGLEVYLRTHYTRVVAIDPSVREIFQSSNPEFLMRYTDKGRRSRPNVRVRILHHVISGRDIDVRINSLGFRGKEVVMPKPRSTYRILFLGDSITACDYLPEEECFVYQVEQLMQDTKRLKTVETINAGVGDIGTREELDILQETGLSVKPDLVVLDFYLNDFHKPWSFPQTLGRATWMRRHSILVAWIHNRIGLTKWTQQQGRERFNWAGMMHKLPWKSDRKAFLTLADHAKSDWGAAWDPGSWKVIDEQFNALSRLSQKNNFKVLVVGFPVAFQLNTDFYEDTPQTTLAHLAKKHKFDYLDLLPILRDHRQEPLFFDGCHPRPRGNILIAKAIADFIRRHMMVI